MTLVNTYWTAFMVTAYRVASSPAGRAATMFALAVLIMGTAEKCDDIDFRNP